MTELTPDEKSRIYEEEKARLEARARLESEQKKKSGPGCATGVLVGVGIIVVGFTILGLLSSHYFNSPSSSAPAPEMKKPEAHALSYEVLRRWTPGRNGTGLELLVSPTATKTEVLQLANELKNEYIEYGPEVIFIFDSREAWANRDNDKYPEKTYWKHFLVNINTISDTGEVKWVAEGRDEPTKAKRRP